MHLLIAHNLAAFRGDRLVFRDVSFAIRSGEILLLNGENGAGKSSLLRAIAGLTPLATGTLSWDGEDALDDLCLHAARIAWLGHMDAVKPAMTVLENVGAPEALAAMGLAGFAELPARMLSAGQKRRLAIARVLASERPLWLLDEPSTALDGTSTGRLLQLCEAHRAGGGMIIASTHLPLALDGAKTLCLSAR